MDGPGTGRVSRGRGTPNTDELDEFEVEGNAHEKHCRDHGEFEDKQCGIFLV